MLKTALDLTKLSNNNEVAAINGVVFSLGSLLFSQKEVSKGFWNFKRDPKSHNIRIHKIFGDTTLGMTFEGFEGIFISAHVNGGNEWHHQANADGEPGHHKREWKLAWAACVTGMELLVRAACVRCHGTKCTLLTAFFFSLFPRTYLSPRRGYRRVLEFCGGF